MNSKDAFKAICDAIEQDPRRRLVESSFDEQRFGSFVVSFEEDGEGKSVVNDRGFVFVTESPDGTGESLASVPSLYDCDGGDDLLRGLNL